MADGIQEGTCLRCGMLGSHENSVACIDTLRDKIATLQFRLGKAQDVATRERAAANGRTLGRRATLKPVVEIPACQISCPPHVLLLILTDQRIRILATTPTQPLR